MNTHTQTRIGGLTAHAASDLAKILAIIPGIVNPPRVVSRHDGVLLIRGPRQATLKHDGLGWKLVTATPDSAIVHPESDPRGVTRRVYRFFAS